MKKELTHVTPVRAGITLVIVCASLAFVAMSLLPTIVTRNTANGSEHIVGTGLLLLFPLVEAIVGFLGGITMAGLYNLVAKRIGGFEIEIR